MATKTKANDLIKGIRQVRTAQKRAASIPSPANIELRKQAEYQTGKLLDEMMKADDPGLLHTEVKPLVAAYKTLRLAQKRSVASLDDILPLESTLDKLIQKTPATITLKTEPAPAPAQMQLNDVDMGGHF